MSRRRSASNASDAGNDSFLDILANLVGILIILVVIVAIRVQQTVQVDKDVVAAVGPIKETKPPSKPAPIVLGMEDLPINVSFAAPMPEIEAEPEPGAVLQLRLAALEGEFSQLQSTRLISADPSDLAQLDQANTQLQSQLRQHDEYVSTAKTKLETLRQRYESVQKDLGRAAAKLDEDIAPEKEVISIHHDIRAIASVAGPDRIYAQLSNGRLTLLPIDELIPKVVARAMRKYNNARDESMYSGRVGPIDGVSLVYEIPSGGSSAIDDVFAQSSHPLSRLSFTVEVESDARSESIDLALQTSSSFRYALSRAAPGTSVSAFVYPDSFAAARQLQEFLQSGGVKLALQPLAFGEPIEHSAGGAAIMAQ